MAAAFTQRLSTAPGAALAARLPPSVMLVVMGLAGLGSAWRAASRAFNASPWISSVLLAVSAVLWVAFVLAQVVKAAVATERLLAELRHPVDGSLASLTSASLLLVAAEASVHYKSLALALFWVGAAGQLAFGLYIAGRWLVAAIEWPLVTPAMYLPSAAGGLVAALAASSVGEADTGWLFFGAGIVTWLALFGVLLGRYISAGEISAPLRPLLGLELAPPALALLAWQGLSGPRQDSPSRIFLGFAIFVALVLLRLAGRLREAPFSFAHWAFALPLAALSTGALRLVSSAPHSAGAALALPLFIAANALVAWIAFRTVAAASRGALILER